MNKRQYLSLCMSQSENWLRLCASEPSPYMRPIHLALIRLAIRRKQRRA